MIWLRRHLGEPFELTLATLAPLTDVTAAAQARSPTGRRWPMTVTVSDAGAGTIAIDGRAVGRAWPAGILWMDIRLRRADRVIHSQTLGIVVLDAAGQAEAARRAAAPEPALGQRRVWTTEGEVLDAICLRELGAERHAATVLDLNSGLAAFGVILPGGVGVILPEAPTADATAPTIRLWGSA